MKTKIKANTRDTALLEALASMEASIGEGLAIASEPGATRNQFGRPILHAHSGGLSYAIGLAMSGIRTAVIISAREFMRTQSAFQEAVRHKLPVVVYLTDAGFEDVFPLIARSGGFAFSAHSILEAVDLGAIAHRVAELALLPGIVILQPQAEDSTSDLLPGKEKMSTFLGDPDAHIDTPTPAQQLLFGKTRRRVPYWFNLDLPALHGPKKDPKALSAEQSASARFFETHVPELITQTFEEFKHLTGRAYRSLDVSASSKPDYWLIGDWTQAAAVQQALENAPKPDQNKTGVLHLRQWVPLPSKALQATLEKAKALSVVESSKGGETLFKSALQRLLSSSASIAFTSAQVQTVLDPVQGLHTIQNMSSRSGQTPTLAFGTPFTKAHSVSPQHEVLLQAIRRAYPGIESERSAVKPTSASTSAAAGVTPNWAARRYRDQGPAYAKLTRFYQDTGYFYTLALEDEMVADPFQALPLIPAGSALLGSWGSQRAAIPIFNPTTCTACGACAVACPHAAMPTLALRLEDLFKGGMEIAAQRGTPLRTLTPLIKNLATLCAQDAAAQAPGSINELLEHAFAVLSTQMRMEGEKLEKSKLDVASLGQLLADLPLAFTPWLFQAAEQEQPGSGLAFGLAIDPNACTGCGVCANACAEDAIQMTKPNEGLLQEEARIFHLWEKLPDTHPETVQHVIQTGAMPPFAALQLQRIPAVALAGGQANTLDTTHKAILRTISSLFDATRRSIMEKQRLAIQEIADKLAARVHQTLSDALPKQEFSLLEEALQEAHGDKIPLDTLLAKGNGEAHLNRVDTQLLQRQTQLIKDLKHLVWLLQEGPSGAGRAGYGVVAHLPETDWLGQYPWNHFSVPVLLTPDNTSANQILGLLQGQMRHWLDNIRLLRRGKLEAAGKYQPTLHNEALAALDWASLEPEEQQACPPLLVVLDQSQHDARIWNTLPTLFQESWPLKVLLLDSCTVEERTDVQQAFSVFYTLLAIKQIPIIRCSLAASESMYQSLQAVCTTTGPACIQLFSAPVHFDTEVQAADIALRTRAFPVATYFPEGMTTQLVTGLSLDGNPMPDSDWVSVSIPMPDGSTTYGYSYADWLRTLPEWNAHFRPWAPEEGIALSVPLYLQAAGPGLKGKVPVVATEAASPQGFEYWIVSETILDLTHTAIARWNTLRAYASLYTTAPTHHTENQKHVLLEHHTAELTALRDTFEARLEAARIQWMGQVKVRLRDKLLVLSKMKK